MKNLGSVGILMIATRDDHALLKQSAISIENHAFKSCEDVRIHLFTDRPKEMAAWAGQFLNRVSLVCHEIASLGWPEVTLYRYSLFLSKFHEINESYVMYLDSDVIVNLDPNQYLERILNSESLVVVRHPGYQPKNFFERSSHYWLFCQSHFLKRVTSIVLRGLRRLGIYNGPTSFINGDWECRKESTAFVPWYRRKTYVYGAIWLGSNQRIRRVCEILAESTITDEQKLIMAKWHDESHLNRLVSQEDSQLACENFCGTSVDLQQPYFVAIAKPDGVGRSPNKFD
jgi:hypothetical protein